MNWFHKLENISWTRLWWAVGIISAFWMGMVTIIPADIFKWVAVPLSALQTAMLFAARGNKYVINRTEPPADGKP